MTLENVQSYIIWDVDPVAFSLFGLEVRWYGVLFAIAFALGYILLGKIFKKEGEPEAMTDTALWYVAIGVVVGARLGHCLFYEPQYFLAHPLEILNFRQGGLASHGAAIMLLVMLWFVAKKYNKSYWYILDRVILTIALSGFFIRMGNLMNSEIYGVATSLPWGFVFVRDGATVPAHPTQIYEALSYLLIFIGLLVYYIKKQGNPLPGFMFGAFLVSVFGMRFLIEYVKEVQELWEVGMALNMGQILSIPFILVGAVILHLSFKRKL